MIHIEGDASNTTLVNNVHLGGCPSCGGDVELIEGRFDFVGGGIRILAGPQWTWDLVDELRLALREASVRPAANPLEPVRAVSPEVAHAIEQAVRAGLARSPRKATSKNRRRLTTAVLNVLFLGVFADYSVAEGNLDALKDGVENVLRFVAQHGSAPPL